METNKTEILKGSALFVLQNLVPLNTTEIAYIWGMYSESFFDALRVSNSDTYFEGINGPYWKTPEEEQKLLEGSLLKEKLVEKITETVKGKKAKSLKITNKGMKYLLKLKKQGMKFKGLAELKKFKPELIKYRREKE